MRLKSHFLRLSLAVALFILLLTSISSVSAALVVGSLSLTADCDRILITGSGSIYHSRNTIPNAEVILLEAYDGLGNLLYQDSYVISIGGMIGGWDLGDYPFTVAPAANPITVRFFSPELVIGPDEVVLEGTGICSDLIPVSEETASGGPGVPSGFVLRTITCETPVYNTAAGQPVGSGTIHAGQTWYVNPTPVDGADGASWTEIFNGGRVNGFILTSCVGG